MVGIYAQLTVKKNVPRDKLLKSGDIVAVDAIRKDNSQSGYCVRVSRIGWKRGRWYDLNWFRGF